MASSYSFCAFLRFSLKRASSGRVGLVAGAAVAGAAVVVESAMVEKSPKTGTRRIRGKKPVGRRARVSGSHSARVECCTRTGGSKVDRVEEGGPGIEGVREPWMGNFVFSPLTNFQSELVAVASSCLGPSVLGVSLPTLLPHLSPFRQLDLNLRY